MLPLKGFLAQNRFIIMILSVTLDAKLETQKPEIRNKKPLTRHTKSMMSYTKPVTSHTNHKNSNTKHVKIVKTLLLIIKKTDPNLKRI